MATSVSAETPTAATETPFVAAAEALPVAVQAAWSFHGFHGSFAVFAHSDAPSSEHENDRDVTLVVDTSNMRNTRFFGRPVLEPEPFDERPYALHGSPLGVSTVNARSAQQRYLLLEHAGSFVVADMISSSLVTRFDAAALSAELAPDGRALVVRTTDALHVLEIGSSRRASMPLGRVLASGFEWSVRGARFYADEATGWQFFDRARWTAWAPPQGAKLMQVADDGSMLFLHGTSLEWWSVGDDEPRASVHAPAFAASRPDEDYFESVVNDRTLAYSVAVSRGAQQSPGFDFHVTSWDESDEVVFRGVGECGLAPERIVSIDEREIKTDVSCSLGCPSEEYAPEYAFYDRRTGVLLRRSAGEIEPSYNEVQASFSAAFDQDMQRLQLALEDLVAVPHTTRRYLIARGGELAIVVGPSGKTERSLADSSGLSARAAVFSADGAWLSLPKGHGFTVWNLRSGAVAFNVGQ